MNRNRATTNNQSSYLMKGTHRSAVIGNDNSARFYIDLQSRGKEPAEQVTGDQPTKLKPKPKRFEKYSPKRPTAEDIEKRQRLASERKQKHNEMKVQQAKKVSEEAIRFDKKVKPRLEMMDKQQPSDKKWYSSALNQK